MQGSRGLPWASAACPGSLVKRESQNLRPVAPQGSEPTRAIRNACCFCVTRAVGAWDWPTEQGCSWLLRCVLTVLIPFDSRQLMGGCSSGHSLMLLLSVYALSYLALIFSWVLLLALGFLTWCRRSHSTKASSPCCVLALLEDREQAVRLRVRTCSLATWVHFPDTERAERLNKMGKQMRPFICQFIEKLF